MSARVISMAPSEVDLDKAVAERRERDLSDAIKAFLRRHGVEANDDEADDVWHASYRLQTYWAGRCKRLRAAINDVLASDALTDEARSVLVGRIKATRLDSKLLTENEAELVAAYRSLSPRKRSALRTLLELTGQAGKVAEV